jgi:hypothetical protein
VRTITITRRSADFYACLKDRPEIWGCGVSPREAIGEMIWSHLEYFGIKIEFQVGPTNQ